MQVYVIMLLIPTIFKFYFIGNAKDLSSIWERLNFRE